MTDLEERIEAAYRQSVASNPYSSLSVLSLCDQAGVSRKMFYRHFKGKNDVLRHIFDRDVVAPQVELCRILSFEKMSAFAPKMERHIFSAIYADRCFYHDVVTSPQGGEDAFKAMTRSAFLKFNLIMLHEYGFKDTPERTDYVASYFADGKASYLTKWIREEFPLTPDEASDLYSSMALPYWKNVLR